MSRFEFIALMACLTALDALAIDSMLPALNQISTDLSIARDNDRQFIVSTIFVGFALGILLYGAVADSLGRRRPVVAGILIFLVGTVIAGFAESLPMLLLGRFIQGFGAAGPWVLSMAIVRDTFAEREMARVMSLIMMIFMFIPMIAPFIGQGVLLIGSWRHIFLVLAAFAVVVLAWFALRQPETLKPADRIGLSLHEIWRSVLTVITHREVMLLALTQGLVFGSFIAFLSTAQQTLQGQYGVGTNFPLYFALLGLMLAGASYLNAGWVIRLGMRRLVLIAFALVVGASVIALVLGIATELSLWEFMVYMMLVYACMGLLMGNLSSMTLSPMGEVAGVASSIIGCMASLIGFAGGALIGSLYQNSVLPLVISFGLLSAIAAGLVLLATQSGSKVASENGLGKL